MDLFYTVLFWVDIALLCMALCMNINDWRMFAITTAVGFGIFAPIADPQDQRFWYFQCVLVEAAVAMSAALINAVASGFIIWLSLLLGVCHFTGIFIGPQPGFGPYRAVVPLIEIAELFACIAMSAQALKFIRTLSKKIWRTS